MCFSSAAFELVRERLLARFGAPIEEWWQRLPGAVAELGERWELELGEPVGRGNTSVVLRCRRGDGRSAMLKLSPDADLASAEAFALRSWEPSGRVPAVWGYDATLGALLLEAVPGETPLAETGADVQLREVAGLIQALHRNGSPVVADGVVSLADRVEFIFEHWVTRHGRSQAVTRVVPLARLERGYELARLLIVDGGAPVLLHGDLHPGNVLDGGVARGLVAIDPRPCVGDAAFDVVDWVFWRAADRRTWEARSRELTSLLLLDGHRLWDWCAAFAAMLAAGTAARRGSPGRIEALLGIAP